MPPDDARVRTLCEAGRFRDRQAGEPLLPRRVRSIVGTAELTLAYEFAHNVLLLVVVLAASGSAKVYPDPLWRASRFKLADAPTARVSILLLACSKTHCRSILI